jgi:hypothetical protein
MNAHKQITAKDTSGAGWSLYWTPPRGLRWMPTPEYRRGLTYVAYKANRNNKRVYFVTNCIVCGGQFLASRIDADFCSNRCTKEHERYLHV